jgi:hypothetical protein
MGKNIERGLRFALFLIENFKSQMSNFKWEKVLTTNSPCFEIRKLETMKVESFSLARDLI